MAKIIITEIKQDTEENFISIKGYSEEEMLLTVDLTMVDEQFEPKTHEYFFWTKVPGNLSCLRTCCFKTYKKITKQPEIKMDEKKTAIYIAACINHEVWLPDNKEKRFNGTEKKAWEQYKKYLKSQGIEWKD